MRYVLDTNVVSALVKGDSRVVARLATVERADVVLPQPVLAEIEYGLQRIERSKRRELLRGRFELICREIGRIEWTDEVSRAFGKIKAHLEQKGQRIEDFDAAIAAHALGHGDVLVTANGKHMRRIPGLTVEDWSSLEE